MLIQQHTPYLQLFVITARLICLCKLWPKSLVPCWFVWVELGRSAIHQTLTSKRMITKSHCRAWHAWACGKYVWSSSFWTAAGEHLLMLQHTQHTKWESQLKWPSHDKNFALRSPLGRVQRAGTVEARRVHPNMLTCCKFSFVLFGAELQLYLKIGDYACNIAEVYWHKM